MKRLLRFLALFGFGLLALVLALGPARLFRRTVEPTIAATDVGDVRTPIQVADPGQKGHAIGVALEGAGRIPLWKEVLEPDGSILRVKSAVIAYASIEPFAGGFHLTRPVIDLHPGRKSNEPASARIVAAGADLATRGDASDSGSFVQGFKTGDVREFTLGPGVVFQQLDEAGQVTLTIETERLEAPEATPDEHGDVMMMSRLVAPGPIHLKRADGSFDLRAGGMELDRVTGRLLLQPKLSITGTDFSLPGVTSAGPARARPPFTLTADGVATFTRRAEAIAGAAAKRVTPRPSGELAAADDPLHLERVFGPGELLFTQNVFVQQKDAEQREQWLRTDRARVELDEDAAGKLTIKQFEAGVQDAPLALGLLGGEGQARAMHWDAERNALVLEGPLELENLAIGTPAGATPNETTSDKGATSPDAPPRTASRLDLRAGGQLIARELPADDALPARTTVELTRAAHAEIDGELIADGERLLATLLPSGEKSADGSGPAAAKLLSVELNGGDAPATAELPGRGTARAQRQIRMVDDGAGGHVVHLEGDARADVDRGFVAGEVIDVVAPADRKQPLRLTVPRLTAGEFALPGGGSPFEARITPQPAESGTAPPRRLVLEPLEPCSLTSVGDALDLLGRCRYHVRDVAADESKLPDAPPLPDAQTLACDELHLLPLAAGRFTARAFGRVEIDDVPNGLHATAAFVYTQGDRGQQLVLDGTPARVVIALPPRKPGESSPGDIDATASRLVLDQETGELRADDERGQVRVLIPEELLADLLPGVHSTVATTRLADPDLVVPATIPDAAPLAPRRPAELRADHLVITPAPGAATKRDAMMQAALRAHGSVTVLRPATRGTMSCRELALDLARGFARLDGDADADVVIQEPKWYAADRIESVKAAWIEVRGRGREIDVAKDAVFVLHPEGEPKSGRIPQLVRVEIHASDPPQVRGKKVSFSGGVENYLERGGDRAHVRSERVELLLDRELDLRDAQLQRVNFSQRVRLDYEPVRGDGPDRESIHAEGAGALLSWDLTGGGPGKLELKEGAQPCSFLAQDEAGAWHTTSLFQRLEIEPPDADPALSRPLEQRMRVEGIKLVVEGPRER